MIKRLLHSTLLLILILLYSRSQGQTYDENNFTIYTQVQGLSNNYVSGIVQDSMDYIWVGTRKGLNRFDGRFFTNYYTRSQEINLPSNMIRQLTLHGRQIIGSTIAGGFMYDTRTRRYMQLVIPNDSGISFWANNVSETVRDLNGDYILSTKTGLYVIDSAGRVINRYDQFQPADAGRVELTFGGHLSAFNNGDILQENSLFFSVYKPALNRFDTLYGYRNPVFKKVMTDHSGLMRASFPGRGDDLFVLDLDNNSLDIYNFHSDSVSQLKLPFNAVEEIDGENSQLIFLNDSLIALTCKMSGFYLLEYHAVKKQLSLVGKKNFGDKHCTAVFKDREGRLWVGTNDGLYKENLSNPFFKDFDLAEQSPELKNCDIHPIFSNHRKLFIGLRSKGGILVLDKNTKKLEKHLYLDGVDGMGNNISQFFPYSVDTLWIGTQAGLFWLNQNNYTSGRVLVPSSIQWIYLSNVLCFLEDRHKNIWISFGRLNSVVYYNRETQKFTDISAPLNPLLKITFCFSMAEDKQSNIWLAGDGLCRWNRVNQLVDTLIPNPSPSKALRAYILILDRDSSNNLWLYTYDKGIVQYNCTSNQMFLRKEDNSLTGGDIASTSAIIRDHIWLGAENGISSFDIRDYSIRLFTYADGLPTVAITSSRKGSWYDPEENLIYIGSRHHLISFRPDLSHSIQRAPLLFIDEILTSEGILPGNPNRIELAYSDNSVQLSFNAINFRNPEDNRFAYQISPSHDSSWHMLNGQRNVNFNNLAPGEYKVRVKLFSANNRWPEQVKNLLIIVSPPFWKRGWFIVLVAVLILLTILVIYRKRVEQMREKLSLDKQMAEYEMKALHAQMNPHFIFNSLNSIREMILHDDNRNASRYLTRFSRLIRLNLEHSKQTFITLQQNIDYLESYLEIEQLRFADFSYKIETSSSIDPDEMQLAPMLIQPLVENAIWHGLLSKEKEKWVRIYFYLVQEKLVCEIEDNGIGIRQSLSNKANSQSTHESMGIGNIRQRIAILNEKYRIDCSLRIIDKTDIPGRTDTGTLITLELASHEKDWRQVTKIL